MKAPSPAFSVYPKDIDSDENCKVMDLREFGAYMRLLLHSWTEGSIPADPDRLAKILGVTRRTFEAVWPNVSPCFTPCPTDSGRLENNRLVMERDKQVRRASENAENGKRGGRPPKSNDYARTEKRTVPTEKPNGSVSESETKGRAPVSSSSASTYPPLSPEGEAVEVPVSKRAESTDRPEPPMPLPPGAGRYELVDQAAAIWDAKRGGENRWIGDLAPASRRYPATFLDGWTRYLDSFAPGSKFMGSPRDFAAVAGVWCDPPEIADANAEAWAMPMILGRAS